jgi:predicted RNase H-like nuclease (RuvC/YqgF family)
MFWDDEPCSAEYIGGPLGGKCDCSRCVRERVRENEKTLKDTARRAFQMMQPRDGMSYDDRSEFERLKRADVDQGKRIAELERQVRCLRTECSDLVEELRNANLKVEELEAENARLRRSPWEGHWS